VAIVVVVAVLVQFRGGYSSNSSSIV